jgi:hypothetical protein
MTIDSEDLLRRLLTDVVVVDEKYKQLSDSDGYRVTPVSDEEIVYCRKLQR